MSNSNKIQVKSNQKHWITSTTPQKDRILFMTKRVYLAILKKIKKHPNKRNKEYAAALIANAEPVVVNKYYFPSPKLRKRFNLDKGDVIGITVDGSEYYELFDEDFFIKKILFKKVKSLRGLSIITLTVDKSKNNKKYRLV